MCGIIGAIAERDVGPILLEGLRRLEYRGYDSAGVAMVTAGEELDRIRCAGKVADLVERLNEQPVTGRVGIAHTRWATHGVPAEMNAHPHVCNETVAVVHNGIIENFEALREQQRGQGFRFTSVTDTEVIAHQVFVYLEKGHDLLDAVRAAAADLEGAYAFGVVSKREPSRLVAARRGSPLVIGIGIGEHFIASDVAALLPVTQHFLFLEDGEVADLRRLSVRIYDASGAEVERPLKLSELTVDAVERGEYRHYMLKEIFEQPAAIAETLEGRISHSRVMDASFGPDAPPPVGRALAC